MAEELDQGQGQGFKAGENPYSKLADVETAEQVHDRADKYEAAAEDYSRAATISINGEVKGMTGAPDTARLRQQAASERELAQHVAQAEVANAYAKADEAEAGADDYSKAATVTLPDGRSGMLGVPDTARLKRHAEEQRAFGDKLTQRKFGKDGSSQG